MTTVRDPHKRLISHIKHEARKGLSINAIYDSINKENSDLENTIHKNILDYGLTGESFCTYSQNKNNKPRINEDIDFIDISDSMTITRIKTAFLSASSFPNVVQYLKLNDSKDQEKQHNCKLSKQEIQDAYMRCVDKGYLEKDESIDYEFLKKKTLDRLSFPSYENKSHYKIHPLTFFCSKNY